MKPLLLILATFATVACYSQGFFGSVKKPSPQLRSAVAKTGTLITNEFRPIVNLISTGYQVNRHSDSTQPGVTTLTGAGISYQHLKFNEATEKWNAIWSINAMAYIGTRISGEQMGTDWYGLSFGIFDNKIHIGSATDFKNIVIDIGIGIPLNNL